MDYETIFNRKEHYVTVRNRTNNFADRKLYIGNKHLHSIVNSQPKNSDIYITKYPKSHIIEHIILDFDSEELEEAYKDVKHLKKSLEYKDVNSVIVESGNKGYHLYIQTYPICFKQGGFDPNELFKWFVYFMLNKIGKYTTLDEVNTSAGLGGNIRVIGSIHPKTNNTCRIIEGDFKEVTMNDYIYRCYRSACNQCKFIKEKEECVKNEKGKVSITAKGDPILENDLREIIPEIFKVKGKVYPKGYAYFECPWHSDTHPSLLVTKEWYSCSACGEKGNIWVLLKKGYLKFDCNGKII